MERARPEPPAEASGIKVRSSRQPSPSVCPYCRDDLQAERNVPCRSCGTAYHTGCALELGRCGTVGCTVKFKRRERKREGPTLPRPEPQECEACGHPIRARAWTICPGCWAPHHQGCAEDRPQCHACGEGLPGRPLVWPRNLAGVAFAWGALLSPVVFAIRHGTPRHPLFTSISWIAYAPFGLALGLWLLTLFLPRRVVRQAGTLLGAVGGLAISLGAGALLASVQLEGAWILGAFTALAGVATTLAVLLTRD